MNVVYKYPLKFGLNTIEMPESAGPVVSVGAEYTDAFMWVLIEDDEMTAIWHR
jgi:hypothetical protein